jgi:hypothetical protein
MFIDRRLSFSSSGVGMCSRSRQAFETKEIPWRDLSLHGITCASKKPANRDKEMRPYHEMKAKLKVMLQEPTELTMKQH